MTNGQLDRLEEIAGKLSMELRDSEQTWTRNGYFVAMGDWDGTELLEVLGPDEYRSMLAAYFAELSPRVVLELIQMAKANAVD